MTLNRYHLVSMIFIFTLILIYSLNQAYNSVYKLISLISFITLCGNIFLLILSYLFPPSRTPPPMSDYRSVYEMRRGTVEEARQNTRRCDECVKVRG